MAEKVVEIPKYDVIHDRVSSEIPMTPIENFMVKGFISFHPDDDLMEAANTLLGHKITGAPVVNENNQLLGFLSEKDCLKALYEARYYESPPGRVRSRMTKNVMSIQASTDVYDVVDLFLRNHFHCYPVVKNEIVVGVISRSNVLNAVFNKK